MVCVGKSFQGRLVNVVAGNDCEIAKGGRYFFLRLGSSYDDLVKGGFAAVAQGHQIARIQSNAPGCVPKLQQGLGDADEIRQPAFQCVVRVDEAEAIIGKGAGVGHKGGEFAVVCGCGLGRRRRRTVLEDGVQKDAIGV